MHFKSNCAVQYSSPVTTKNETTLLTRVSLFSQATANYLFNNNNNNHFCWQQQLMLTDESLTSFTEAGMQHQ